MRLVSLSLNNFMCFSDIRITFNKQEFTLIRGIIDGDFESSNGAGKTALVDGIYWILFGKPLRSILIDNIIKIGKDYCKGTLKFEHNNKEYEITRFKGKTSKVSVKDFPVHNTKQLDEFLISLGINKKLFILMSYFHPENISLASGTPSERTFLIDSVIDSNILTKASQLAGQYLKKTILKIDEKSIYHRRLIEDIKEHKNT